MVQNAIPNSQVHPVMTAAIAPHLNHTPKACTHTVPIGVQEAEPKHRRRKVTAPSEVERAALAAVRDMMRNVQSPWVKISTITLRVLPETYVTMGTPGNYHEKVTEPLAVEASASVTMEIRGMAQAQ